MGATTLAIVTALSTASQVVGQQKQAKALERLGDYESQIFGMNAELAEQQAADAIARGAESEQRHRGSVRALKGAQRSGFAGMNIDVSSGSAIDVQSDTETLGELDALTIRNNARREAWGYQVHATNLRAQGEMARRGRRNQAGSVRNQSYGTLLQGAASTYATFKGY